MHEVIRRIDIWKGSGYFARPPKVQGHKIAAPWNATLRDTHSLLGTLAPVFTEIASTYPCATAPQRNSRKQLSSTSDSE